jgi:hypothetical protein
MSYKNLRIKVSNVLIGIKKYYKTDRVKLTGWLCSGWDSPLLKYDGEVFLGKLSSV